MTLIVEVEVRIRTASDDSSYLVEVARRRSVPHLYFKDGEWGDLTAAALADEVAGAAVALPPLMDAVESEAIDNATAFVQQIRDGLRD